MDGRIYNCNNIYVHRRPILPLAAFFSLHRLNDSSLNEIIKYYINNEKFMEAIRIGSKDLYNDLLEVDFESANTSRKKKLVESLTKYYLRASTRPTPFGLFGVTGIGYLYNENTCEEIVEKIGNGPLYKYIDIDMQWLLGLITKLESNLDVLTHLNVKFSNITSNRGDREVLLHSIKNDGNISISIKSNELISFIKKNTENYMNFCSLAERVYSHYKVNKEVVYKYLFDLVQTEYLVTELKPSLSGGNLLKQLIDKIKNINVLNELYVKLSDIHKKIIEYRTTNIGEGIRLYNEIEKSLISIYNENYALKVDFIDKGKHNLSKNVVDNITKAGEVIDLLTIKLTNNHLSLYKNQFIEKYGQVRVKLLDLIDEVKGLGFPVSYKGVNQQLFHNSERKIDQFEKARGLFINMLFSKAIRNNDFSVNINDESITQLKNIFNDLGLNHPLSMEIYFSLINNKIIVNPNIGSNLSGRTFSRFSDYFISDNFNQELLKEIDNEIIFANIRSYASKKRNNNILIGRALTNYEINLGVNTNCKSSNIIDINDLYVEIFNNNFILYSKKLNKYIIPVANNMWNKYMAPNIYRLLIEIGESIIGERTYNIWGEIGSTPILPRITYENVIISPKTWNINKILLESEQLNLKGDIKKLINSLNIPRFVYLQDEKIPDNKILLDLQSNLMLQILEKRIKNIKDINQTVTLYESFINNFNKNENDYHHEYILGLVQKELPIFNPNINTHKIEYINSKERYVLPSEKNWLFFKFYIDARKQNDFITGPLLILDKRLKQEKMVKKSYFIRYRDLQYGFHIRYRVNINRHEDLSSVLNLVNHIFRENILGNFGAKYVIDTYEPEFERYLGFSDFYHVEDYFCLESNVIMNFLKYKIDDDQKKLYYGICSILNVLNGFGLKIQDQFNLISNIVNPIEYSKNFRREKNEILNYCNPFTKFEPLIEEYKFLRDYFKEQDFLYNMDTVEHLKSICKDNNEFLLSVLHMHINRLFGIDREFENYIYNFSWHILKSLLFYVEKESKSFHNNQNNSLLLK
ncbi:lantibiotic dehydratase [Bacillus litorisediminis]|uniref:lantibiotic dehydratase n=1 Tax=Bacillus litorisediminis TaxID=2922713 RepID=UPI001FAFAFA4|nr:lantibiotic dehydratase [Bacillus litorisediminis]